MQILDGERVALKIREEIKKEILEKTTFKKRAPVLCFVLVGKNESSKIYVNMKDKRCKEVGICSKMVAFDANISQEDLIFEIQKLNLQKDLDGILVQLPLPASMDVKKVMEAIDPEKDVDGFHPLNIGKMVLKDDKNTFFPCTPYGIITLLKAYNLDPKGKEVVIVGRSNVVGMPLSILLKQNRPFGNATVTVAHRFTKNLAEITKRADILIVAVGKPKLITKDMVKNGVIVIDVGINRIGKKIVGDVDFENVAPLTSYITPVPKGVGPMTIAMLLKNTLTSYLRKF